MSFKVKLILTYVFLIIVVIFFSAFFTRLKGERFLNTMKFVLLWVGAISILVGSALALFVSQLTVNPIKKMVKFSKKIEKGDYSARINAKTKDEIGQLGRALDHMAEHLSEIEKMRKTLVQNVSHDLRTPLTVINGYLETLDNKDFTKKEKEKSLKIIKVEVERMESMLNELSVLSALDSKKYKLKGTNAIISIKDTGKGIPGQELSYIFDRFYRGEKSRSRTTGGLGIGLTIIKELIYAHNGTIKVKSELGKGTEFILSFPISKSP